tara:strand:+ start:119 stop:232 length:114 start_codon:yes stop_codon:yes gene_type:complete
MSQLVVVVLEEMLIMVVAVALVDTELEVYLVQQALKL